MNETEHAVVLTRERLYGLELESKCFPLAPNERARSILCSKSHASTDAARLKLKIDGIEQRLAIELQYGVSRPQANALGKRVRLHRQHTKRLRVGSSMPRREPIFMNGLYQILIISLSDISRGREGLLRHTTLFNTNPVAPCHEVMKAGEGG